MKVAANALVDDPVYRKKLAADLRARRLHPTIESMLWYYAKGKPKETVESTNVVAVEQTADPKLQHLSDDQLLELRDLYRRAADLVGGRGEVQG